MNQPESNSLETLLNLLPTPVFRFDRNLRHTFANVAAARAFGCTRARLIGTTPREAGIAEPIAAIIERHVAAVLSNGQPAEYQVELPSAAGPATILTKLVAELGLDGRVTGVVGIGVDISAQTKAQRALRDSEERYRKVLEDQTEMVCRFRGDGTFTFVNEVYCRTFGRTAEQLLGNTWEPVVVAEDLPRVHAQLANMAPGNPVVHIENRVIDAAGRVRWMEFVNRGFFAADGTLIELQAVGRDVTDRRAAEQVQRDLELSLREKEQQNRYERHLLQAQKLESLGVLAGGIAHDFNNLLTAVLGYASLARLRLAPDDGALEDLGQIEAAAMRAAELCQQMLAYAGRGRFSLAPVALNALTEEMGQLLRSAIGRRATLRFQLLPGLPAVQADATQLRQVVTSLITNASDSIGDNDGVIAVSTAVVDPTDPQLRELIDVEHLRPGRYVRLRVADDGAGMSEEARQRIFDPFFTNRFAGRGLGLAAVQGIVKAHHGAVRVESELDRGTTFTIWLPALDPTLPEAPPPRQGPQLEGRGRRVLVVDDEANVRSFVQRVLEKAGFQVTVAADGRAGVEAFAAANGAYELVLLDLTMPRLSGRGAFAELRQQRPDVRIVLTSGFAEEEATANLQADGLAGFLRKPFRTVDLLAAVRTAIGP